MNLVSQKLGLSIYPQQNSMGGGDDGQTAFFL